MATVRVTSNAADVSDAMRALFANQIPFALSRAMNVTLNDAQADQREHQKRTFAQRRARWQELNVKIRREDRAHKRKLEAIIRMEAPGGGSRSDILVKFETEEFKLPFRGRSIAVPTEHVPRTGKGVIRKGWRPRDLNLRQHGKGRVIATKGDVFRGDKRTIMIRRPGGRGTIFRRMGRSGSNQLVPIYQLVPRVDIDPELHFVDNVTATIGRTFNANFAEEFRRAVQGAR